MRPGEGSRHLRHGSKALGNEAFEGHPSANRKGHDR
jgi:hypothetical protein